ncbi:MAG: glycolate oxidase iron-sulfur subunit [Betaproteobacteria bacterium]|nr:MAG: glycolate oxidase iron-sulfur subunit [Betaproteobacteria bacterium]
MQTNLADFIKDTPQGKEADAILRACVHCGFCTATCPTYQILGDELDGPRGRIYMIKQVLEGVEPTKKTQQHLDRCLTCRNCESTCPSGVQYGRLIDIGRNVVEEKVGRTLVERAARGALRKGLLSKKLFSAGMALGRAARPLLPKALKSKVQPLRAQGMWPDSQHARTMIVLDNCVQNAMAPAIDFAAARVLDKAGVTLKWVSAGGCCGALSHHMNAHEEAAEKVRANIDAWWPLIEGGAEAIVGTASGCSVMLKDYGHFMQHDAVYADKAAKIAALSKDVSEVIVAEWPNIKSMLKPSNEKIAYHPPCTMQHGMKLKGGVETMLKDMGYSLAPVADSHLCCGSAGTYSVLQSTISNELKARKVASLTADGPAQIATSNIGCMTHIQSGTTLPVKHWIELLDERLGSM